jgi:hypothetical protein
MSPGRATQPHPRANVLVPCYLQLVATASRGH